jgi:hypothetical protein
MTDAPMDAMDAALGSAMDSAIDQGGPAAGEAAPVSMDDAGAGMADAGQDDVAVDVDPSAGMG